MALPTQILTQTETGDLKVLRWLEIEGCPFAVGNRAMPSAFWTGGTALQAIVPVMTGKVPKGVDVALDLMEGIAYRPGEIEVEILDNDPTFGGWFKNAMAVGKYEALGVLTALQSTITASGTTIDAGASAAGWGSTGIGYIGKETFVWGANSGGVLTSVQRGVYRSTGIAHSKGEAVTMYPTVLGRRRVWYYLAFQDPASQAWLWANRMTRFGGTIIDYSSEGGVIRLKIRSGDGDLGLGNASMSPKLFRTLRHGKTLDTMGGWQ